jgi:hypothetical protein
MAHAAMLAARAAATAAQVQQCSGVQEMAALCSADRSGTKLRETC